MRIYPFLMAGLVKLHGKASHKVAEKLLQCLTIGVYRTGVAYLSLRLDRDPFDDPEPLHPGHAVAQSVLQDM
jgi:hypothetical protein